MIFHHKNAVKKILNIEKFLFENNFQILKDFQLWPLLRGELWWNISRDINVPNLLKERSNLEVFLTDESSRLIRSSNSKLRKAPSDNALILTKETNFQWKLSSGKWYDVRFDEIIEILKKKGLQPVKWLMEEDCKSEIDYPLHSLTKIRFKVLPTHNQHSTATSYTDKKWNIDWKIFVQLATIINDFLGKRVIGLNMVNITLMHINVWRYLLEDNTPKVIFIENYYNPKCLALIIAAHELGIPVVDVAHGKQGKYHAMYSHWLNPTLSQSVALPDFYWVWGKESARNINKWKGLRKFNGIGPALHGGNPSLGRLKDLSLCENTYNKAFARMNLTSTNQERVGLISLQHKWSLMPEFMFDLFKVFSNWNWILRLHPVVSDINVKDGNSLLKAKGIYNATFSNSREIPLPLVLEKIDIHLTAWSSVCYEALAFNKPTVFFGPEAKVLYKKYIEEGYFSYGASVEDIVQLIENFSKIPLIKENQPYLLTDLESADKAVTFIVNNI